MKEQKNAKKRLQDLHLEEIIKHLKTSSPGYDNISALSIQKSIDIFLPHLVHLINASLSHGVFPDALKKANIIPLSKQETFPYFQTIDPFQF